MNIKIAREPVEVEACVQDQNYGFVEFFHPNNDEWTLGLITYFADGIRQLVDVGSPKSTWSGASKIFKFRPVTGATIIIDLD